jgi:PTH1 family peptidyl-tRNA hydrolase
MGIGHPGHKDLVSRYVLHDFAKADEAWLDTLLRGICDGAADLALGDGGRFMNAVALRTAPPRSSQKPKDSAHAEPSQKSTVTEQTPKPPKDGQQAWSALERLKDKFK